MNQLDDLFKQFKALESSGLLIQFGQFMVWTVVIVLLTWLVRKGINRTVSDHTMQYRARKVIRLVSYAMVVLLAVITFTGKVQYFTIAIGLISAGLAFALQEVILSVAGWVAIYGTGLYKPGDRIEINNVKGDVIDIGITRTTLMEIGEWVSSDNYSGRIVQVSNGFVFKGNVQNYSTDFPFVWDEINLPIRYGSDLQVAHDLFMSVARKHLSDYAQYAKDSWNQMVKKYLIEDAHIEPSLTLQITDKHIAFNLRYIVDYKKRRFTKDLLCREILDAIEKSNGKVSLASPTLEILGTSEMTVHQKKSE